MFYLSNHSSIFGIPQLLILAIMAMTQNLIDWSLIISDHSIEFHKDVINSFD